MLTGLVRFASLMCGNWTPRICAVWTIGKRSRRSHRECPISSSITPWKALTELTFENQRQFAEDAAKMQDISKEHAQILELVMAVTQELSKLCSTNGERDKQE